jgi:hypothetical protein
MWSKPAQVAVNYTGFCKNFVDFEKMLFYVVHRNTNPTIGKSQTINRVVLESTHYCP